MKILYHGIILILTILSGSFLFENQAYALWIPLSPQELLEQSMTIFVGNVTDVAPVDVQYQSQWARNGTMKQSVGPETMTLDEYTVHVEEFLKNPQDYDTIKLRQATVSGAPTGPSTIGGFEVGDRVLFYLPKYENQTHFPMQYLPESFKIPQSCNGQDVLTQKRIEGSNNFTVIQNGIKVDYGNFNANKPIKFLYDKDMNTLFGKSFDVMVGISKITDQGAQLVFSQEIHAGSKQCQWVTSAEWEFTPTEGQYSMDILTKEGGDTGGMSHTLFSVKSDAGTLNHMSPLKQIKSGITPDDIHCKDGLFLVISNEKNPFCLKPGTISKLASRGLLYGTKESSGTTITIPPGSENQASNKTYSPDVAMVVIGINNTIRWVNQDDVANTIVPDMPVTQDGKSFGSYDVLKPGGSYQFTFTQPGTYPYHAEPHPWQKGTIIVLTQNKTNQTTNNTTCDIPYLQKDGFVSVLYMPANSTGKVCVDYSNGNPPTTVMTRVFDARNLSQDTPDIKVSPQQAEIPSGSSTVVYTVTTGGNAGFYGLTIFCFGTPLAVGYENDSRIVSSDFPWLGQTFYCPSLSYNFKITGVNGMGIKYVPFP